MLLRAVSTSPTLTENSTNNAGTQTKGRERINVQNTAPMIIERVSEGFRCGAINFMNHLPTLTCSTERPNTYVKISSINAIRPRIPLIKPGKIPTLVITATVIRTNPAAPAAKTLTGAILKRVAALLMAPGEMSVTRKPTVNQNRSEKILWIKKLHENPGANRDDGFLEYSRSSCS